MPILTTIDRDLLLELAAEPLLLAPNSQYPDLEQLEKLVDYGWGAFHLVTSQISNSYGRCVLNLPKILSITLI